MYFEKDSRCHVKELINSLQAGVTFHIETSHLICIVNLTVKMTVFYMECITGQKFVNVS